MSNLRSLQESPRADWTQRLSIIEQALTNQEVPVTVASAAATIAPGVEQVFLTYAGVTSLTLPSPVAGTPGIGSTGQDGATLEITDTTGHAHTITTGANGINGSKHVITFPGTVGTTIKLRAFNGSWWVQMPNGAVLA